MELYKLESMARNNPDKLIENIKNEYHKNGIQSAISYIKMSNIAINKLGTLTYNKILSNLINYLIEVDPNKEILSKFINEIKIINNFYTELNKKISNDIEKEIQDNIHFPAFLLVLELTLHEIIQKEDSNTSSAMYENIIENASLILKYFNYKKFPVNGSNKIIRSSDLNIAQKHIEFGDLRVIIETVKDLWSYFNTGFITHDGNFALNSLNKSSKGFFITQLLFQNIRDAKMAYSAFAENVHPILINKNISNLPPTQYLNQHEKLACEFIEEYFYINDLTIKLDGIPIKEWIRAYSIIAVFANDFREKRNLKVNKISMQLNKWCLIKDINEWKRIFEKYGVSKQNITQILGRLTFKKNSRDLFDCPLIPFEDKLLVLPSATFLIDCSRALLSNLTAKGVNVSIKGTKFEKEIRSLISKNDIICKNLKDNIKGENYECDIVFSLDGDLFIFELKNLPQPQTYKEYKRFLLEIEKAKTQLRRNSNHFLSNSNELLSDTFKVDPTKCKVYKIILTNVPIGEDLDSDDIYVTDSLSIEGFFKRNSPSTVMYTGSNLIVEKFFRSIFEGQLSKQKFIKMLQIKPHILMNEKRIGRRKYNYGKQLNLILETYFVKLNSVSSIESLRGNKDYNNYIDHLHQIKSLYD
ncbi:hypothetical protein GMD78_13110 [Ornithinibacillus sp. L9]|uniref:NERD domain-containing protein n=1 Tax=Ornithinibacillus caprae TaxID=2678566 RepID=A0A6N8FJ89_9BACI|nr:hypothetical protein [Ornithinibacillus caprae]MUK89311.1 hypothetical protein [Ornithinibacillus caprae]